MTSKQYRAAIKKLGLSQGKAAEFLGISARTSRCFALDERPVRPEGLAKLLRYMVEHELTPEDFP